jgi:hypothetical protein
LGRAYANFVQVSHSPFDFTIRFCEAPSSADIGRISGIKEQEDAHIEISNVVELIVAPNLLPQLIEALQKNYEKYLKQYGAKG